MRLAIRILTPFIASLGAFAQPVVRSESVVNAANYLRPGLPNHGIAQGGMFILKGTGLGPRGTVKADSFPLQTNMGGTSMRITVAGSTVNVLMVYVAGEVFNPAGPPFDQLAGIVPSTTPIGTGTIAVTYRGQTSAPVPITIVPNAFGIFSINQAGSGPGVFTTADYQVPTLVNAAHPGDLLFIWGTGLGAISGSDAGAPPVGDLNVPVEVYVGTQRAAVSYQGRSGCCAGLDQILFRVPSGQEGCYVPVAVKIRDTISNFVTLPIASTGSVCSDPNGFTTSELQKAQSNESMVIADIGLQRLAVAVTLPGTGTLQGSLDFGEAGFTRYEPGSILASTRGIVAGAFADGRPSTGCIVFSFTPREAFFDNLETGASDAVSRQNLDAGLVLNLTGPTGARQLERGSGFGYGVPGDPGLLGGGIAPYTSVTPDYLTPGTFTVDNGSGATSVGPFSASLTIPANSIAWTNQGAISTISRSQDLTVTWTGGTSGAIAIEGTSANPSTGVAAGFQCTAPASAGTFTVPSWVLSALPVSGVLAPEVPVPVGFLWLGTSLSSPTRFQARGVDAGYFSWGLFQLKNVNYQ